MRWRSLNVLKVFRRAPVTADMILTALESGRVTHQPLTANG